MQPIRNQPDYGRSCGGCEERQKLAVGWNALPKGWTQDSVKKFWSTLTGDRKHKVTACHKKMKDKFGDEGAWGFCASLADMIEGTGWRGKEASMIDRIIRHAVRDRMAIGMKLYYSKSRGGFDLWGEEQTSFSIYLRHVDFKEIKQISKRLIALARGAAKGLVTDFQYEDNVEYDARILAERENLILRTGMLSISVSDEDRNQLEINLKKNGFEKNSA